MLGTITDSLADVEISGRAGSRWSRRVTGRASEASTMLPAACHLHRIIFLGDRDFPKQWLISIGLILLRLPSPLYLHWRIRKWMSSNVHHYHLRRSHSYPEDMIYSVKVTRYLFNSALGSDGVSVFHWAGKPQKRVKTSLFHWFHRTASSRFGNETRNAKCSLAILIGIWLARYAGVFVSPALYSHFHQSLLLFRFRIWSEKAGPWSLAQHHWLRKSEIESELRFTSAAPKCMAQSFHLLRWRHCIELFGLWHFLDK